MWHLEAASSNPASAGLILFNSAPGSPLHKWLDFSQDDLLFLEIDQILVVVEDLDVGECPPCILYFLGCNGFLVFFCDLALPLLVASPSPLNLNRCYMVHCKSVVLEQPPCQWHLVGRLNETCAEVLHASLFVFDHHVEGRSEEFLTQALGRRKFLAWPIKTIHNSIVPLTTVIVKSNQNRNNHVFFIQF